MIVINTGDTEYTDINEKEDKIIGKGPVKRKSLIETKETNGFGAMLVRFEKGARLNFHVHDSEQILYVTEGKGIVATRDKEYVITPGSIVFIPAGEVHWHGATADSALAHIAIQKDGIRLAP